YGSVGRVGKLTIDVAPSDPGTANAVGVNLWKDGSLVATGAALGSTTLGLTPGRNSISFAAPTFGPMLVQVYNYAPGTDVAFQLLLSWIDPPVEAGAIASALSADNDRNALSGTLAGNRSGSFVSREFWSPGDGSTQAVALAFAPSGPDVGSGV